MSSDKDESQNNSNSITKSHKRLCHIVKRPDFDGYGFNLHSEKGKPGQYVGKVDENSPAERAGLLQGDRILEVNGVNIGSETHKQVVQRIKAISNEVRLLVINPEYEHEEEQNQIANTTGNTITIPESPKQETSTMLNQKNLDKLEEPTSSENSCENNNPEATKTQNVTNTTNNTLNNINNTDKSTTVLAQSNGNANSTQQKSRGLNLPITAAEMKAKLMAKKKYDPKNDSVDVRKKFEIIQKL